MWIALVRDWAEWGVRSIAPHFRLGVIGPSAHPCPALNRDNRRQASGDEDLTNARSPDIRDNGFHHVGRLVALPRSRRLSRRLLFWGPAGRS